MKKEIFFAAVFLFYSDLYAGSFSQLPSLLRLENGLSTTTEGAIVADSRYKSKSDGENISIISLQDKPVMAVKKNAEGTMDYIAYESTSRITLVNLGQNGYKSSTSCQKNINPGAGVNTTNHNLASCVTLNQDVCNLVLKESGAKNWYEFQKAQNICKNANNLKVGLSPAIKNALKIEKENVDKMKILASDIKFSDYKPSASQVQLQDASHGDADYLRRYDFISDAVEYCSRSVYTNIGVGPKFKFDNSAQLPGVR